ncbi:MAG: hypothetical protein BWY35_01840 [Firmicutes bacterium ADurb.Bin248]|nr:MAG: hypothetical protein BWY35_01840 [Firmicutes bacterium ADurb.Bin248]HOG01453.1 DUF6440 family protein [Clostridia bacterium]HPK15657.1 DUF6440 family protein [Clostridia bacterium]
MAGKEKRFFRIFGESRFYGSSEIWVDTKTGVNYFFHQAGYAGGLSVLLDETGKPVITPKFELENLVYNSR